jgi:hypothetical protein
MISNSQQRMAAADRARLNYLFALLEEPLVNWPCERTRTDPGTQRASGGV